MDHNSYNIFINNWIVRVRQPEDHQSKKVAVLLHGWTGDENSMWIFSSRIPENYWIFAPRAPHPAPATGYEWAAVKPGKWPEADLFIPVVKQLHNQIQGWKKEFKIQTDKIHVMGFSQGAAIAYIYSFLFPKSVDTAICLSGFLPRGAETFLHDEITKNVKFFIAHGTEDETVPVEQAHFAAQKLTAMGANVRLCEDHVGHKISASCFREIDSLF